MTAPAYRFPFSPYPDGWFAVAWSAELKPGEVQAANYMGRDLVVYRTEGGQAVVADAYCPHLGAHLGHVGSVEGEELRCAFHGFCYSTDGDCTKIAYGSKPPPKAKLQLYPVHEFADMVLAWFHHEDKPPLWEVPEVDQEGWSSLTVATKELRTHPQETTENSVDMGHLVHVHLYRDVEMVKPLQLEGPNLYVSYGMTRDSVIPNLGPDVRAEFDVMVHGLGYSLVEVEVKSMGFKTRHYVMNTPIDGDKVHVRAGVSINLEDNPVARRIPKKIRNAARKGVLELVMWAFKGDMAQDYTIWETKKYADQPALAQGDGPLPAFRKWAKQFYGPMPEGVVAPTPNKPESGADPRTETLQ